MKMLLFAGFITYKNNSAVQGRNCAMYVSRKDRLQISLLILSEFLQIN